MPEVIFTLTEAEVALYPVDEDGDPISTSPVFLGCQAEDIRLTHRFERIVTKPTGEIAKVHHLGEEHEISFGRLWLIQQPDTPDGTPTDYRPVAAGAGNTGRYVLIIAWQSSGDAAIEMKDRWVARIYTGVTTDSFEVRNRDLEFICDQTFSAQSFTEVNGTGALTC